MMRAAVIQTYVEDIDKVTVTEIEKPQIKPDHVLLKIKAAAGNPIDSALVLGDLRDVWSFPFPYVLGEDFAGVVEEVGEGVANFRPGDEVFGMNWGIGRPYDLMSHPIVGGAFAEYLLIPANKLSHKPGALDWKFAAALGLVGTTAYEAIVKIGKVTTGNRVVIFGGSSSVGIMAIQLAKHKGAKVCATAKGHHVEFVQSLGLDKVLNVEEVDWTQDPELKNVDVVFDTIGENDCLRRAMQSGVLASGGKYITIADFSVGYDPLAHPPVSFIFG
jgi:NADPH:quinone reductase-like Zn-dependent oxidoreductase